MEQALVLCSGGIDSVVTAYLVRKKMNYDKVLLLFFDYGQNGWAHEKNCASYHARQLGCELKLVRINLKTSALIHKPRARFSSVGKEELKDTKGISKQWYVPCRNLLFMAHALSLAEEDYTTSHVKSDIFVGFGAEGSDSYPDAGTLFLKDINLLTRDICAAPFVTRAPFLKSNKEDIISKGALLGVNFEKTWSCYAEGTYQCGACLACALRKHGFYWANIPDPTSYVA